MTSPEQFLENWVGEGARRWVRGPFYILARDRAGTERLLGAGVSKRVVDRFLEKARRPDHTYEVGMLQ